VVGTVGSDVSTHLRTKLENKLGLVLVETLALGKTFQNLRVSSPAPVTMVSPVGFIARNSTRLVCPVKVVIFYNVGYFHTTISLFENPWVLTNSVVVFEKLKLQTCEPVSMLSRSVPLRVFQNLIVRSADPPPDAKTP
jgi:hypothetical protein